MADQYQAQEYYDQNPQSMDQYSSHRPEWQSMLINSMRMIPSAFGLIYRLIWGFLWRWWK